jgi:very-short-patch-repair endonuclease
MSAVLTYGPGTALSYRSGGHHLGLRRTERRLIDVTAQRGRRPQTGIQLHYGRIEQDEITVVDAIPVTTCARTLLDLAAVLDQNRLEQAINQAEILDLFDATELNRLIDRYPHRRGIRTLRAALGADFTGITRSDLEDLFVDFVHRQRLPMPELNVPMRLDGSWIEVDCVWRRQRVIVEADGRTTHHTRAAFENDRRRDRALQVRGWRVLRVTSRQLTSDRESLAADLRKLLTYT